MNNRLEIPRINRVAVFLALFYAFSTRSIIGPLVYRGVLLWAFYGITYLVLGVCLINSFRHDGSHLYAPKYFFSVLLLLIIVVFGLYRTGSMNSLLYYGIAFLLPFALLPGIKDTKGIIIAFVIIGVVLFIGCLINYLFPTAYRIAILPLFSESTQSGLNWQAGFGTFFPGFTSQVGYTSYFLSTAFGALFCFRKSIYKRWFVPIAIVLIFGMLLTGKRGPIIFLLISILVLYFYESRGRERFVRVLQIALIAIAAYFVLFMLARFTDNPSITRIFESVQELIFTRDIEDTGRDQLRNQALIYFSDNMIFGIGWNNFHNLFTLRSTHVHNIYFQLLCETGIVGFLIFVLFFAKSILNTLKKIQIANRDTYEYSWLMLSLFLQIYFLLYGISGNPLYDVEETILYFFGVGISFMPMLADVVEDDARAS
jgi:O-antigen ligase